MRNIGYVLITVLLLISACGQPKQSSQETISQFPNNINVVKLGLSADSLMAILSDRYNYSVVSDYGNGFSLVVKDRIPYFNILLDRVHTYVCQKHGVIGMVGVKEFEECKNAEECFKILADTITSQYSVYSYPDSVPDETIKKLKFKNNQINYYIDLTKSSKLISIAPDKEIDLWTINIVIKDESCNDL